MRELCFSTEFPHQEIRWNYGILQSVTSREAEGKLYAPQFIFPRFYFAFVSWMFNNLFLDNIPLK